MIVIVIIGVVYTLVITKLDSVKEKKSLASLSTLKEYLGSFSKGHESVELLCKESCSECALYVEGQKVEDVESFFDESIEFYTYRYGEGASLRREDSCFRFSIDAEGIADQVLISYDSYVYDYTPYFQKTKRYDSLSEAVDAKDKLIEEVLQ